MALSSLSAVLTSGVNINATQNVAGLANGLANQNQATKSHNLTHSIANSAALGVDEAYFLLLTVAASGTATIDLSALVDVAGATVTLVGGRLKGWRFHLLGLAETAPDTTPGTACSGVTVGPAAANGFQFNLDDATATLKIHNASVEHHGDGTAAGYTVDATHKLITITNLDVANAAVLLATIAGCTT